MSTASLLDAYYLFGDYQAEGMLTAPLTPISSTAKLPAKLYTRCHRSQTVAFGPSTNSSSILASTLSFPTVCPIQKEFFLFKRFSCLDILLVLFVGNSNVWDFSVLLKQQKSNAFILFSSCSPSIYIHRQKSVQTKIITSSFLSF